MKAFAQVDGSSLKPKAPNYELEQEDYSAPFGLTWYDVALIGGGITILVAVLRCVLFCCEFRQGWVSQARIRATSYTNSNSSRAMTVANYGYSPQYSPANVNVEDPQGARHWNGVYALPYGNQASLPSHSNYRPYSTAYEGRQGSTFHGSRIIESHNRPGQEDVQTLTQIEMARRESLRTLAEDEEYENGERQ